MTAHTLQLGLDKVRVKKEKLLSKLRENLEKHQSEFKEAREAWRGEVILEMKKNLAQAQDGGEIERFIHLDEPIDHSDDYRHVISLLEASEDEILVINSAEFRQYYEDQWRWTEQHKNAIQTYSARR